MAMTDEAGAETGRTRAEISKRSFLNSAGEYSARASTDTTGFRIELVESGDVVEYSLSDFEPGVLNAAAAFGIVTSVTNTIGGKSLSAQERLDLITDRLETLLEGDWTAERQSGPRNSQLIDALVKVRADAGKDTTQEWRDKVSLDLKANPDKAKAYLANAHVAAAYAEIKAKAAMARAQKLAAKADSADEADTPDFLED